MTSTLDPGAALAANPATQQALSEARVSGAQVGPVEQEIAQKITQGLLPTPTSTEGWLDLVKQFTEANPQVPASTPTVAAIAQNPSGQTTAAQTQPGQVQSSAAPQSSTGASQAASGTEASFVQQMAPWARYASQQTGLDANVILAQWGNETGWGTSTQWTKNFNPAGIGITSDAVAGQGYGSVQGGVQAYINFFNQNPRYQSVKAAQGAQAQAIALGNSGWAAGMYNNGGGPGSSLLSIMGSLGTNADAVASAQGGAQAPANNGPGLPQPNMGSAGVVTTARSQLGIPYQWGGESPGKDFDCSGLVQWAYGQNGVSLPRTAQAQYDATMKVPAGQQLQPGDLVFYGSSTTNITHVGIYIGNNQMIDAPHTGAQVRTENYNWGDFVGATRPTDATGTTFTSPVAAPTQAQAGNSNYYQALSQIRGAMAAMRENR